MRILILFSLIFHLAFSEHLENLIDISKQIRGESWNCVGDASDDNFKIFKQRLELALNSPEKYKSEGFVSDEILSEQKDYFRFWAYKSIGNFKLYNKFWDEYKKAIPKYVEYYEDKFKYDEGSAIYYSVHLMNEFLPFCVGNSNIKGKISDIENILTNKNLDKAKLSEYLYNKPLSRLELTEALNTALLFNVEEDVLEQLILYGANLNTADENSLFFSVENLENLKFLVRQGAKINYQNSFGKTVLFYAVEFKNMEVVKFLLENGADVNKTYITHNQKQAYASSLGLLPFYQNLCDLEHTQRSVFMHAAYHANAEILKLLTEFKADINLVDDMGYNAFDYAVMGGNQENIEFLKSLGMSSNLKGD